MLTQRVAGKAAPVLCPARRHAALAAAMASQTVETPWPTVKSACLIAVRPKGPTPD
jgi:hypothetical protein